MAVQHNTTHIPADVPLCALGALDCVSQMPKLLAIRRLLWRGAWRTLNTEVRHLTKSVVDCVFK
jgi:hypothetical protein